MHALYKCPHASNLWDTMRKIWGLQSHGDLHLHPSLWFQNVILNILVEMIDTTLLVAWRTWHCRNEVNRDKLLPMVENSKRFMCS
jgi:hypothetical protein